MGVPQHDQAIHHPWLHDMILKQPWGPGEPESTVGFRANPILGVMMITFRYLMKEAIKILCGLNAIPKEDLR